MAKAIRYVEKVGSFAAKHEYLTIAAVIIVVAVVAYVLYKLFFSGSSSGATTQGATGGTAASSPYLTTSIPNTTTQTPTVTPSQTSPISNDTPVSAGVGGFNTGEIYNAPTIYETTNNINNDIQYTQTNTVSYKPVFNYTPQNTITSSITPQNTVNVKTGGVGSGANVSLGGNTNVSSGLFASLANAAGGISKYVAPLFGGNNQATTQQATSTATAPSSTSMPSIVNAPSASNPFNFSGNLFGSLNFNPSM